eukprot:COSAG01_NODE_1_length_100484_cov_170.446142_61_plen_389_part_00
MSNKFKIKTYNKISDKGLSLFSKDLFDLSDDCQNPDAIILRSFKLDIGDIPNSVKAIARAGAGVNNIPLDHCSSNGVVVFNTPGANANAVKELVICAMFLSSRNIIDAVNFTANMKEIQNKEVEKIKSQFKGSEIKGKRVAVLGLGAIGISVANALQSLGMHVYGYDPFISVKAAWGLSSEVEAVDNLNSILPKVDFVTLHMPLNANTESFINSELLKLMNQNVSILNFSRAEIVSKSDMLECLKNKQIKRYITDFPCTEFQNIDRVISLPHLGASTEEAEDNCAMMAVNQLQDYLLFGNIKNSVNFPLCTSHLNSPYRVAIKHKNIPNMVQKISALFGNTKINIVEMLNKSQRDLAYTLVDINEESAHICDMLQQDSDILEARILSR